jgi:N-acetylglucosaminyldiphosphoundecaprenol N-acetyl-beta-D-mannosaminyltransferase
MFTSRVNQTDILGVPITCFNSYEHATDSIVRRIRQGQKAFCVVINPEKVCFALAQPDFADLLRKADIHICDGVGTAAAVRLIQGWRIPRITGVELFFRLLKTAERENLSVFLFGAKPEVNRHVYDILRVTRPNLRIAGRYHGFFDSDSEVIRHINASQADMLFVALGSPQQERWLGRHLERIHVPFCMGVGGSFNVLAGDVKRAPELFQRTGTEFLYRLACEPWRWRRQSVLPGFTLRVFKTAFANRGLGIFVKTMELRHSKRQAAEKITWSA